MKEQTMTDTTEIRRHADGSIDTRHYMQIGRQCRSKALHDGGRRIAHFASVVIRALRCIWSPPVFRSSISIFAKI